MRHPLARPRKDQRDHPVVQVLRVVDGDTIDCIVDLDFGLTGTFRFRVAGIDTPEVFGHVVELAAGQAASEFTKGWIAEHEPAGLIARTTARASGAVGIGDAKFGRWAAAFIAADDSDLASALTAGGHLKVKA